MKFYTISEVAEISNKSQKSIRRYIASGLLSAEKISNKYRIFENDLNKWLEDSPNLKNHFEEEFHKQTNINYEIEEREDIINYIDISDNWKRNYWENKKESNGLNFIDLFAGAGGLSLGMVMAGYTPVSSVEIMPTAVETYEHNFINKRKFAEKIETRDIRDKNVKNELYQDLKEKEIDVICGGFPCQGFSLSGNRVVTDERNNLYKEMLEIVKKIKPKFVIMENVVGLRSMLNGKIEQKIILDYEKAGYKINVAVLNSADYEVPQIRKRVIFIGNRLNKKNYHPKPLLNEKDYKTTREAIKDLLNLDDNKEFNHIKTKHREDMIERLSLVKEGESLYENYSDAWKKCPWDKPSCTIKENHGGVNIHPKLPRVLTAREMARLQSFPDDFIFKGAKKWQLVQIGNAVPPLLGKAIGLAVEKSIKNLD